MKRAIIIATMTVAIVGGIVWASLPNPQPSVGLYFTSTSDPTSGAGVAAPLGQLLFRQDVPSIYFKTGTASTAWTRAGSGTSSGGTVTSVACGTGLSCAPSPIVAAGTVSVDLTPTTCSAGMAEIATAADGTSTCAAFTPAASVSGTLNTIAKFTPDGSSLGNSSIGDDGTIVSICTSATVGCGVSDPGKWFFDRTDGQITQRYTPTGASNDAYTIANEGVAYTGIESGGFQNFINTTFDTTISGGAQAIGFLASAHASRVGGVGLVQNYGVISNATGGDLNYSFFSALGTMANEGDVVFGPGNVTLGSNVQPFVVPGSPALVASGDFGFTGGTDGFAIHTKNTVPGATLSGIGVFLDTTVEPNARGGLIIQRGPGGTSSGNSMGVSASITNFPFVGSAPNDLGIYNELSQSIVFGADSSGFTSALRITTANHVVQDASTGTPTLSAACNGAGAATIVGNDNRVEVTTGTGSTSCVITYKKTWTVKPMVTITAAGGIATPTCTWSATAITCTVNVAGDYVFDTQGQPGST